MRLFFPDEKACRRANFYAIEILELLRIFSGFIGFNAFFSCFFYDYIIHPTALPLTRSTPTPAHSEHPSGTQPRHYLYMFTYPRPQRRPPTIPYSIGQEPTGSPL